MSIQINRGIQLPAFDVEMLTLGKLIAVPFKQHIKEGQVFWLYPSQKLPDELSLEQYYQQKYLTYAEKLLAQYTTYPIDLKAWARCEYQWRINSEQKHLLPKIAKSTIWNASALEHIFEQHQVLRLLILRVYHLPNSCIINVPTEPGFFYWPQSEDIMITGNESDTPVISDDCFNKRKAILLAGKGNYYNDLETLLFEMKQISNTNLAAQELNHDIKTWLGWTSDFTATRLDLDLDWIQKIAEVGNSSDGQTFEKLVRKSLIKLGFTNSNRNPKASLDPESTGGAGGIDVYCEAPYPVVGECKASKKESVPNSVTAQLIHLGVTHLGQAQFDRSIKLIFAAGPLTEPARKAAVENKMNVMRPETLQSLVELQAKHKNSVDLLELKKCLQQEPFGLADDKVKSYIEKVKQDIKLRSHIVHLVKNYQQNTGLDSAGVEALHGAYFGSNPPQPLKTEEMHEILIELSSPLTGYLGRIKLGDWRSDRFYFLRELKLD